MSVKNVKKKDKNTDSISIQFHLSKKVLKMILIGVLCVFILVGGYFLFKKVFRSDAIKVDWGQTYYVYLKEKKEDVDNPIIPEDSSDAKLNFYEVKDTEKPVMAISYKKEEQSYTNVFYIQNNQVNTIVYNNPVDIEFLYNIEKDEYNYYFHTENDLEDTYTSLTEQIKESLNQEQEENIEQEPEYTIKKEDVESAKDSNRNEITVTKEESIFIKPEVSEKEEIAFHPDMEEEELKEAVNSSVSEYEPIEEIADEEIQKLVEEKKEEITNKQEEIKKIIEEQEKLEEEKEEVFKKLQGVWISGSGGGDPCVEIGYKNKKKWAVFGWFGSEASLMGEIKDIKPLGNQVYELTIGKNTMDIDISKISNHKIKVNKEEYKYVAKNMDKAYEAILGFSAY